MKSFEVRAASACVLEFPATADLVIDSISDSIPMQAVVGGLGAPDPVEVAGLVGAGRAAAVAAFARVTGRLTVWFVSDSDRYDTAFADLSTLLGPKLLAFPARDARPYQWTVPSHELVAQRLKTLATLLDGPPSGSVMLVSLPAWFDATLPPEMLRRRRLNMSAGDTRGREDLIRALEDYGYLRSEVVEEVGQYAVRGGIVDLFPTTYERPVRVEFWGDQIDSLRLFEVGTQRTVQTLEDVEIWPQREAVADRASLDVWLSTLPEAAQAELEMHLDPAAEPPGIEWLFSALDVPAASPLEYLPANAVLWLSEPEILLDAEKAHRAELAESFRMASRRIAVPSPDSVLPDGRPLADQWLAFRQVHEYELGRGRGVNFGMKAHPAVHGNLPLVKTLSEEIPKTLLWGPSAGQLGHIFSLLDEPDRLKLCRGSLVEGFRFDHGGLLCLTEHELFARRPKPRMARRFREGVALSSYTALQRGDYVVHVDYGVGRYRGLRTITVGGQPRDFLELRYLNDDKVFVPVEAFNRVRKFSGKDGQPQIAKLGSGTWEKIKERTKRKILEMAEDLVRLYAARKSEPGYAFGPDDTWMAQLEETFPHEETPDQAQALAALKADMQTAAPMDRLVCGDVGFGKTELAVRGALKATTAGKQVAVLVPTTILAQQHLETFTDRLGPFPVRVEMLSRFKSAAEQKEIVADIALGKVDIVIGTHRLLSKDVQFRDLGLLVVDEEQRFGVAHKERIKKLKTQVDCITLTATPIPRTLQMSLLGARDLSVINTPPKDRLPIHTEVVSFSDDVITYAVNREIDRGGQVFFVHNRVQSIAAVYRYLKNLFPALDIVIAHGQMKEDELERVMLEFSHRKHQILLSTAIIESGLDIPAVNTMLVNRAHTFGLAQLYQLRGRVGRSARQAYAYLLVPPAGSLTKTARRRLAAIEQHSDLGSGFHLAMRDLEIRGAGNLLGAQQHGFIEAVGFDLYCRMIEEAVAELKGQKPRQTAPVQLDTSLPLRIPDDYIPQPTLRVDLYQRLADASSPSEVEDIRQEAKDRFGVLPEAAENLFDAASCRLVWAKLGVTRVQIAGPKTRWEWGQGRQPARTLLADLAAQIREPHEYHWGKTLVMEVEWGAESPLERFRILLQDFWNTSY
jgi:transcription-repair coupling factor (superfamily II helicase)